MVIYLDAYTELGPTPPITGARIQVYVNYFADYVRVAAVTSGPHDEVGEAEAIVAFLVQNGWSRTNAEAEIEAQYV